MLKYNPLLPNLLLAMVFYHSSRNPKTCIVTLEAEELLLESPTAIACSLNVILLNDLFKSQKLPYVVLDCLKLTM